MMFSPYVNYVTQEGLPGVKVRQYHPVIFIPNFIHWLKYWKKSFNRYKEYEKTIKDLNKLNQYRAKILTKKGLSVLTRDKIRSVNCGYDCGWSGAYGFVPEDGCPIHDVGDQNEVGI